MRLGRLTGLEHDKIQAERDGLVETIAYYESVLADENKLLGIIREEILEVRRKYADPRRTEIARGDDGNPYTLRLRKAHQHGYL